MKKNRLFVVILLCFIMTMCVPVYAGNKKEKDAVKKQIKIVCDGIANQNPKKMKKVIKKWYAWFDPSEYENVIGKEYLKECSEYFTYKVNNVKIKKDKAVANITLTYIDSSPYYYMTHRWLKIRDKHAKGNFSEQFQALRKAAKESNLNAEDFPIRELVSYTTDIDFVKKKGKWIIEVDPASTFFNAYTSGYNYDSLYYFEW